MDVHDSTTSTIKVCTKCGEAKPRSEYYRHGSTRDGLRPDCKACKLASDAAWRAANPEIRRASNKTYLETHSDAIRAYQSEWRAANAERLAEYRANYRSENRARWLANSRQWALAHPERVRETHSLWCAANPERRREQALNGALRRRARKANAPVVERIYRAKVWERDGGRCHICHKPCDPNDWHLEHIVPLSRGGEHSYRNVAVSHPVCNQRKGVNGPAQARLLP